MRQQPLFPRTGARSGAEFESGARDRARGANEAVPGVDVVDGREQDDGFRGGHTNYAEADGRRRKLRETPGSKEVVLPGKGRT